MAGRTSLTVYEGMIGMSENVFINIKNRSHTITAEVEVPEGGANGVILAQAGRFGGWSLYLKDGKPTYTYNFLGLKRFTIASPSRRCPPARRRSASSSPMTAAASARAASGRSSSTARRSPRDGSSTRNAASSRPTKAPMSARDEGTPVTEDYKEPNKFTGKIDKVTIELKEMKKADSEEAVQGRKAAVLKKGLSD